MEINVKNINDPEWLREMHKQFCPCGSGPLSVMSVVCDLIKAIAEEKGVDLKEKND